MTRASFCTTVLLACLAACAVTPGAAKSLRYATQDEPQTLDPHSANLAVTGNDRDRAGQPFTYAVLTHDFTAFRAHVGYGFQRKGAAAFVGIDKTVKVGGRDLMLRSDLVQIDDRSQWLGSAGFLLVLHKNWVLEAWASQPTERGEARFTLKLNYVMKY